MAFEGVGVGPETRGGLVVERGLEVVGGGAGRHKGVMDAHGGLLNRLLGMHEEYRLGPGDVVLQKPPFSFDVSVWEFFWSLMEGGKLVVARAGGHQAPGYLATLIEEQQITTL